MSWEPLNWASLDERPPVTPSIGGLVYPGRRHVFSGPPEAAKTWAAFALALDVIRAGGAVLHVDFEMFAYETRDRLRQMGATAAELDRFLHVEPEVPATPQLLGDLVDRWALTLAIIDAAAGAYALHDLDDHKRQDAEKFATLILEPLRARGVASITLDHVPKNAETRGRFAIGSERKIGGTDVHLGFEPVVPFGRGRTGLVKIVTHKDRFGFLPRPSAAELELRSDPDSNVVTWAFRPVEQSSDSFRPTVLMEKVSKFLQEQTEPASRRAIETNVPGRVEYVRQAIDALVADGYATEAAGPRRSRLVASTRPFTSSDLVPPRPDEVASDLVRPRPSLTEGTRSGTNSRDEVVASVDPDEVERLAARWSA